MAVLADLIIRQMSSIDITETKCMLTWREIFRSRPYLEEAPYQIDERGDNGVRP
jgi:hypothetical protein